MAFHNVRLSDCIERGAQGGPNFNTAILELGSGYESREGQWAQTRGSWDIGYALRNRDVISEVLAFFYAREGRAHGFRFKDWSDYKVGDTTTNTFIEIGTGDGSKTEFQAVKRYTSGSINYDRELTRLVDGTVRVFVNGVEQTELTDYTVNINTGAITFFTAPAASLSVALICEFDVPVRFDSDLLNINTERDNLYGMPGVILREIRDTEGAPVEEGPWTLANKGVKSFSVAADTTSPQGLTFKPDGTLMYVVGLGVGTPILTYSLSTAWDVTTSSLSSFDAFNTIDNSPTGIYIRADGAKLYVTGDQNDKIYEFNLPTPFSISSKVAVQNTFTALVSPRDIFFRPDGLKMYLSHPSGIVQEYNLSTAWDISTISPFQTLDIGTLLGGAAGTVSSTIFRPETGRKMFTMSFGGVLPGVNEFTLSTPWDISTASYVQNYIVASGRETSPRALSIKTEGDRLYYAGSSGQTVYQFNLAD